VHSSSKNILNSRAAMNLRFSSIARGIAAAAFACFAQGSFADATFTLYVLGSATHSPDSWECITCDPGDPKLQPSTSQWKGTVTVVTSSGADGIYTGSDVQLVSFVSNLGTFSTPSGGSYFSAVPTVIVTDGSIESLTASWSLAFFDRVVAVGFSGQSAWYNDPGGHHYGPTTATGLLLPTPVPEPGAYALLLAGLGVVAGAGRRRRAGLPTAI
jgi:hypothetical protein